MTNDKIQMTKEIKNTNEKYQNSKNKNFDLEERTLRFAKNCIDLCKVVFKDFISTVLVQQLIRASTSIGANYREANESITKKDFFHRIGICRRESKESRYWLELLSHTSPKLLIEIRHLSDEALQLARIFASISRKRI